MPCELPMSTTIIPAYWVYCLNNGGNVYKVQTTYTFFFSWCGRSHVKYCCTWEWDITYFNRTSIQRFLVRCCRTNWTSSIFKLAVQPFIRSAGAIDYVPSVPKSCVREILNDSDEKRLSSHEVPWLGRIEGASYQWFYYLFPGLAR